MKISIIGGGASGIAAAICAKRNNENNSVTVFERSDRVLRKLLATGNGRCNLSNESISIDNYYSRDTADVSKILSAFTPNEERQFFESIGLLLCSEDGRIYPYSRRANAVSDALRYECERLGVNIRTNSFIDKIEKKEDKFLILGEAFDKAVISCGGFSAPSFGTDGNSFTLLKSLGHTITKISYALSPVKVYENVKSLKGIRTYATLTLINDGKKVRSEKGELQLTDYGLSGIAVMQLSRECKDGSIIEVDLMSVFSEEKLIEFLTERKEAFSHLKADDFLTGFMHKTLAQYILAKCNIRANMPSGELTKKDICVLGKEIKALSFKVKSVLGKEQSQATCGGALISEFDADTLESKKVKNLYCIGEALDCVGDCGGYNLHWAWTTAYIAGKNL